MNARGFPSTLYVTTYSHVGETGFPYFPACQGVSSPYLLAYSLGPANMVPRPRPCPRPEGPHHSLTPAISPSQMGPLLTLGNPNPSLDLLPPGPERARRCPWLV